MANHSGPTPFVPDGAKQNTDIELWRKNPGDYYSPSIHATLTDGIGINVGGSVYVKPIEEWHRLAGGPHPGLSQPAGAGVSDAVTDADAIELLRAIGVVEGESFEAAEVDAARTALEHQMRRLGERKVDGLLCTVTLHRNSAPTVVPTPSIAEPQKDLFAPATPRGAHRGRSRGQHVRIR